MITSGATAMLTCPSGRSDRAREQLQNAGVERAVFRSSNSAGRVLMLTSISDPGVQRLARPSWACPTRVPCLRARLGNNARKTDSCSSGEFHRALRAHDGERGRRRTALVMGAALRRGSRRSSLMTYQAGGRFPHGERLETRPHKPHKRVTTRQRCRTGGTVDRHREPCRVAAASILARLRVGAQSSPLAAGLTSRTVPRGVGYLGLVEQWELNPGPNSANRVTRGRGIPECAARPIDHRSGVTCEAVLVNSNSNWLVT